MPEQRVAATASSGWRRMRQGCLSGAGLVTLGLTSGPLPTAAQEPAVLDEVIVEAPSRTARPILETPVAVTVIERDALERRQATTFEELIGDAPGVSIGGGPRAIAQEPNIRGFQDDQVVLRFDGGRFNFNQAHRGRFFVDPDIVERVEIVRGGGSTLYGSGALGGVISFETREALDLLEPGRTLGGRLRVGYADNGETALASATAYGAAGPVDVLGFFGVREQGADLVDGNRDDIRDSDIDVRNGLAKLGFQLDEANRLELSGSLYRDNGTTPPNANAEAALDTIVDRDAEVVTARVGWDFAPSDWRFLDLSVLGYFNGLEITEDRNADGRDDRTEYDTYGIEVVNRSRLDVGLPLTLVYGVEAYRDIQTGDRDDGDREQFPDAEATTVGGFVEATVEVTERLSITPGVRFDHYSRDPDGGDLADVSEGFFSPRLGVSYRATDEIQVFGNIARAFRAPNLTELYADGVHFSVDPEVLRPGVTFNGVNSFVPNPDLEPETSTQVELGARYDARDVLKEGDRLKLSGSVYVADVDDFIDQNVRFVDFDTATPGPGGLIVGGTTTSRNVDALLYGLEIEGTYDAGAWFAGLGLTVPRGDTDDGDPLGSVPQDRLTLTLGARPLDTVEVGGRATLAGERDDVVEDTQPAGAFAVFDLFAAWAPASGPLAGATFRAGVDNVTDTNYRIFPNGLNDPGRTFKVSAAIRF